MNSDDYADTNDALGLDVLDRMSTDDILSVLYADAAHADVARWTENNQGE